MDIFRLARFAYAPDDPPPGGDPALDEKRDETTPPDEKPTGADPEPKGQGTFSQAQVNEVVKNRLAQANAKHRRELDAEVAKYTSAEAELEQYRTLFQGQLTERLKGESEAVRSLVQKLDPVDQLAWLTENPLSTTATPPPTPPGDRSDKKKPKPGNWRGPV